MTRGVARAVVACVLAIGAGACRTVGPTYQRPTAAAPAHWSAPDGWRPTDPRDAVPKGPWWTVFRNDELSALEAKAVASNLTLQVVAAQYQQAQALAALAMSGNTPHVSIAGAAGSLQLSGTSATENGTAVIQNSIALPLTVSYEVDLFGKRLRSIEAAQATLESTKAANENVRLMVTAELAADYFTIRRLDTETGILDRTIDALNKALVIIKARRDGGIASGLDVAQEETLIASTRTQATLLLQERAQVEHAIALLIGEPAPEFHLGPRDLSVAPPAIDAGMPSDLLERRPDVADAERQMAAANARIGIAKSAFYPSLDLLGTGGVQTASILKLFNLPSLIWSIGATASQDLFTGGAREAQLKFAEAGYDASVASYRETVLQALQEVEDSLAGLGVLNTARGSQDDAIAAARRALDIATNRYQGGLTGAIEVVTAQQTLLDNQRTGVQIQGAQLVTTVLLVKALGGGWK